LAIEDIRKKLLRLQEEEDEITRLEEKKLTLHGKPTNKGQNNQTLMVAREVVQPDPGLCMVALPKRPS
jgi:hypothetical protein